ncbi:hypothetical protein BRC82_03850 [Halobacteriales archaeon QS_1_67_19]|nr:MAG: hypothetical protein BRC82_03850 [Halobacteriales archaeon QS_1_67_19]
MADLPTYGDGTDGFFGLLAGLYAAALAAPAVAVGVALGVTADPGVLFFALLGTGAVVAGAVGWPARRTALAVRLGVTPRVWVAMVLPFAYFGLLFGLGEVRGGDPPSAVAGLALVGAIAGVTVGVGLATAARNRHAKAVLSDADELVRFSAPAPERDRRVAKRVGVGAVVVSVAGMIGSLELGAPLARGAFQFLAPLGASLFGTTTTRRVAVTDAGLLVGNPVSKTVRPWGDFESYAVTDEAVVVRRDEWSLWGLWDVRRDAGEIEDPEAVAEALAEFLPKRADRNKGLR